MWTKHKKVVCDVSTHIFPDYILSESKLKVKWFITDGKGRLCPSGKNLPMAVLPRRDVSSEVAGPGLSASRHSVGPSVLSHSHQDPLS